jgi:hypothetical protein
MIRKAIIGAAILVAITVCGATGYYIFQMSQARQWRIALSHQKVGGELYNSANNRVYEAKEGMEFLTVRLSIENLAGWTNRYTFKDVYLTDDASHTAYSPLGLVLGAHTPSGELLAGDFGNSDPEIEMGSFFKDPIRVGAHQTMNSPFETTFAFLVPKSSHRFQIRLCPKVSLPIPLSCDTQPVEIAK